MTEETEISMIDALNSFHASRDFCLLLIIFANALDPDQVTLIMCIFHFLICFRFQLLLYVCAPKHMLITRSNLSYNQFQYFCGIFSKGHLKRFLKCIQIKHFVSHTKIPVIKKLTNVCLFEFVDWQQT